MGLFLAAFGYRNWAHTNAGGAQDPEGFDDCDSDIVDLALKRLEVAAERWSSSRQPFFLGVVSLNTSNLPLRQWLSLGLVSGSRE